MTQGADAWPWAFLASNERLYVREMTGDDGETVCPYCRKNSAMIYVDGSARLVSGPGLAGEAAFQCYSCKRFVIGGRRNLGLLTPQETDPRMQAWGLHHDSTPADIANYLVGNVEYWEPVSPVGRTIENVPPEIGSAVDEAYRCMSIGAFRASVLMARGVIEAGAKASGVTKGTLASKIDELAKQNLIRPLVAESAHEVRHVGNDVAHGDFALAEVAKDDVEDVLELMEEIVDELFVLPTRVQRRKNRRNAPDA